MTATNTVLIIVGGIVTLIGILAIFIPNLTKIINAPGNPRIKAIIAIIIGIIILAIGLLIELPVNS